MARATSQIHSQDESRTTGEEWQDLRSELVSLLDEVETQATIPSRTGPVYDALAERVRDLRTQMAGAEPGIRHREALRSVQRAIDRFSDRDEPVENPRDTLEAAIRQIRARHTPAGAAPMAERASAPRIDGWAQAAEGISSRLERLEGELRVQSRSQTANVKEIADQIGQLSHVMELLAGAVGEAGQVKRLESQIASLASILAEDNEPDLGAFAAQLEELTASARKLGELAGLGERMDDVSANVARLVDLQADLAARPVAAPATVDTEGLESGIRTLYDRIDALEGKLVLPATELDRLSEQLGQIAAAIKVPDQPQGLLELIDALNARVNAIEARTEDISALRDDVSSLRATVSEALEPRFAAFESGLDAKLNALGDRVLESAPRFNPAPLEAQVRQLVARMDQTGEQLSGLAKLYTQPAPPPDIAAMAELVAEKTVAAVAAAPSSAPARMESADFDEIERRVNRIMDRRAEAPAPELVAVETTIREVGDRLGRLEAMLTERASRAEAIERAEAPVVVASASKPVADVPKAEAPKPAVARAAPEVAAAAPTKPSTEAFAAALLAPSPATVSEPMPADTRPAQPLVEEGLASLDASLADDELLALAPDAPDMPARPAPAAAPVLDDAMPASPAEDAPLIARPFVDPAPIAADESAAPKRRHPGLDPSAELPPKPFSDLDSAIAASAPPPMHAQESAAVEEIATPLDDVAPPPSRNTFIEAHRRAARMQAQPNTPSDDSLIGRAFARFQAQRDAAARASAPVPPPAETAVAEKPAARKRAEVPVASAVAEPVAADAESKDKPRGLFSFSGQKTPKAKPEKVKADKARSRVEDARAKLAGTAERRLAGDKISPTTWTPDDIRATTQSSEPPAVSLGAEATSPAADDAMPRESFLLRHRRPILLGASLIAIACLAINLINQRLAESEAAAAASPAPATTGDLGGAVVSPTPMASQDIDAVGGPAIQPLVDQMTTASIGSGIANAFAPTSNALPQTAAFAVQQVASMGDAITLPSLESPVQVDMPPSGVGPDSLRTAAANGDARAQFEVAAIYTEGRAVPEDPAEAAVWYERSASQGFTPAQYRLGTLYEHGNGVTKDLAQARLWYQRAAEAGNRLAMHNLAALYASGELGRQQFDAAAKWFEEAANRGIKDSQFNLGMLYARGLGVQQDLATSYKWFGIAASRGDADAAKARDDMAASLDAATVARVNDEIAAWHPQDIDLVANFAPIGTWETSFDPGKTIETREVVRGVQLALTMLGFDVGTPDGLAGPKTADAIRAFERSTGMSESGAINPRLLAVLGSQPV